MDRSTSTEERIQSDNLMSDEVTASTPPNFIWLNVVGHLSDKLTQPHTRSEVLGVQKVVEGGPSPSAWKGVPSSINIQS